MCLVVCYQQCHKNGISLIPKPTLSAQGGTLGQGPKNGRVLISKYGYNNAICTVEDRVWNHCSFDQSVADHFENTELLFCQLFPIFTVWLTISTSED